MIDIPQKLDDTFKPYKMAEANKFAEIGTVKHFALRLGILNIEVDFSEVDAEAVFKRLLLERDWLEDKCNDLYWAKKGDEL